MGAYVPGILTIMASVATKIVLNRVQMKFRRRLQHLLCHKLDVMPTLEGGFVNIAIFTDSEIMGSDATTMENMLLLRKYEEGLKLDQ